MTQRIKPLASRALALALLASAATLTPACAHEFDTDRDLPERGSVGEEIYGVVCDRVGAQALREDLTGASFRDVCHRTPGGDFADKVDTAKLPAIDPAAVDESGARVSVEQQEEDRARAIGKIEALARRRADLIAALDATLPDEKVEVRDLKNPDPTKTCEPGRKGSKALLADELARMLGRVGSLYEDGTIPEATRSLGRVVDAFKESKEAREAWMRVSAREGYRPIDTALGVARPVMSYPNMRNFANATLRLLAADSKPYDPNPQRDAEGNRIPVPGPGNAAMNKMLELAREELLATKVEPERADALKVTPDPRLGWTILSRPRDNIEILEELMFAADPSFGQVEPRFIVRRDRRGFARLAGTTLPKPFVDEDGDGLPDVDRSGFFVTAGGGRAPAPFLVPGEDDTPRDEHGRALVDGRLVYDYLDTSHTFAAQALADMKPLAEKGVLTGAMGAMPIVMGERQKRAKSYDGRKVEYSGFRTEDSPLLDLVYALGVILTDRTADQTLQLGRELFAKKPKELARAIGALSAAYDIAQQHPEAKLPKKSTFWDEKLDVCTKIAKHPGLLEEVLRALAHPDTRKIGAAMASYAKFKDEISYDRSNINGGPFNVTMGAAVTPRSRVDVELPRTQDNRSVLSRFLQLMSDTEGVTACNRPQAKVHAKLGPISVTMPPSSPVGGSYKECEVFKIEDLASFYIDVVAQAWEFDPESKPNKRGTMYLRNDTLRNGIIGGIGAATTKLIEDSSGIKGFVDTGNDKLLTPTPKFLNRLVFFDMEDDQNERTKKFVRDLSGDWVGTSVCPERIISDPLPGAPDAASDGLVRGLRDCGDGTWLQQRGKNTAFALEHYGFFNALKPLARAFAKLGREDLFVALSSTIYRHMPGKDASESECLLANGAACPRDGMDSYEPLLGEVLGGDVIPAISELLAALQDVTVQKCEAIDPTTKQCTRAVSQTGFDVIVASTRAMLDPDYARSALKLTDRHGGVKGLRNDGTTNPQVTPIYLLTNALAKIDDGYDRFEAEHPEDKGARRAGWRAARSAIVDQFFGVDEGRFTNPAVAKMTPKILDLLRGQIHAHCPRSFVPPYETCTWAREELVKTVEDLMKKPLLAAGVDVFDAITSDPEGRKENDAMIAYLLDAASKNDALDSVLAAAHDALQLLRSDEDLVPLMHFLGSVLEPSEKDANGRIIRANIVDAQMSLLAKMGGRFFDGEGNEICSKEIDPNGVLPIALGHLVSPMKSGPHKGKTPFEVIVDVIADVNRTDPTKPYDGELGHDDYVAVSENVVEFLTSKERGLEQLYEVIRQGLRD